jgi:CheY-like chemotaxis protein
MDGVRGVPVFLVEDHEDTRLMYSDYLRQIGFGVTESASPRTAFAEILATPSSLQQSLPVSTSPCEIECSAAL